MKLEQPTQRIIWIFGCAIGVGIIAWFLLPASLRAVERRSITSRSQMEASLIAGATQSYYENFQRWPIALGELRTNRLGSFIGFPPVDQWGRTYIYRPPTSMAP